MRNVSDTTTAAANTTAAPAQILWHYTTGEKLAMILRDREIKTTDVFIEVGEKPAAWFSTDPVYEASAAKTLYPNDGSMRTATIEEMQVLCGGVWRIGIRKDMPGLINWKKFKRTSGISRRMAKALEKVGLSHGGHPSNWYASYDSVPVSAWVEIAFLHQNTWMTLDADGEALAMLDEHFEVVASKRVA